MEILAQEGTPIDINFFDLVVNNLYNESSIQNSNEANLILIKFKERPDAWLVSQQILTESKQPNSRFIALQVFIDGAKVNWEILNEEQRNFFKKFFFDLFFQWSRENESEFLMNKASYALISVLKNEWPTYWPNFMHDFFLECKNPPQTIKNGLKLLSILCEIYEFPDEMLTNERMNELTQALENEYNTIFLFLESVFNETNDFDIISQALDTLSHYLRWMDLQTITSAKLCFNLVKNLFPYQEMRYAVLKCFDSIATNIYAIVDQNLIQIFELMVTSIQQTLDQAKEPITVVYSNQDMNHQMILTLGHFFVLDQMGLFQGIMTDFLRAALIWFVQLTEVCSDETFNIAVEFWLILLKTFNLEANRIQPPKDIIYQLQRIFIQRMARPQEFSCLLPDDIDTSSDPNFLENMRLTIVCLSNLGRENIVNLLLSNLQNHGNNIQVITVTCWSIGAISGSLIKEEEQHFLVNIINILFLFITDSSDNDFLSSQENKSLICGCYMYILSLYPRFLSNNWSYFKQLLDKIIEFIHTRYPPLQQMAATTLKNVSMRIPTPLLIKHIDQQQAFVFSLLDNAEELASVLPMEMVPIIYESIAFLIKNHRNEDEKSAMVSKLLVLPVKSWEESVSHLNTNTSCDDEITLKVLFPLDIFGKIILISNFAFYPQIEDVITRTMNLFKFYSTEVARHSAHPNLLKIKTQILLLYESFFKQHPDSEIVPGLVDMLLTDYSESPPAFRFHLIIDCFTAMIDKLGPNSQAYIVNIVMKIIVPTFSMINDSYENFPEIRISLFQLLNSIMTKVFFMIQSFDIDIFTSIIDCLLFGIKNPKFEISSRALNCLSGLLNDIDGNIEENFRNAFYNSFYLKILFSLFSTLTDRGHKLLFLELTKAIIHLFQIVCQHKVLLDGNQNTENIVAEELSKKLSKDFPQIHLSNLYDLIKSLMMESASFGQFQQLLRLFLIDTKKMHPSDIDLRRAEIESREMNEIIGLTGPAVPSTDYSEDLIPEF